MCAKFSKSFMQVRSAVVPCSTSER